MTPFDNNELEFNTTGRKPYNTWLSTARCRTEMAFAIFKKRFKLFRTPVEIDKHLHIKLTKVGFVLQNICIDSSY